MPGFGPSHPSVKSLPRAMQAKIESALELKEIDEYQAAIDILLEVNEVHPDIPGVLGLLGGLNSMLSRFEVAAKYYKKTTILNPESLLATRGLFNALWRLGRIDESVSALRRFLYVAESKEFENLLSQIEEWRAKGDPDPA